MTLGSVGLGGLTSTGLAKRSIVLLTSPFTSTERFMGPGYGKCHRIAVDGRSNVIGSRPDDSRCNTSDIIGDRDIHRAIRIEINKGSIVCRSTR